MSQYTYQSQHWNNKKKNPVWKFLSKQLKKPGVIKNLILFFLFLFFLGSIFLLAMFAYISHTLPNPGNLSQRSVSQTTKIFDRAGEHLLYEIFGNQNRTLKKLQQGFCDKNTKIDLDTNGIPMFAVQATVAAEDRSFCEHSGFDVKGMARALLLNLIGKRVGGSTLTQQLVKNAILSNEKTMTRKIKELILSIELERKYSKDEILQIYFNEIPYGSTYYGIEAASQNFYEKDVNKLSIAEAATLAAIPKSPTTYINNPDLLRDRRNYVLGEMQKIGFIDKNQYEQSKNENTNLKIKVSNITAPHFVFFIKEQLEEKYGQRTVEEGGLKVITTLDYDLQQKAEEEIKKGVEKNGSKYGFTNASLVAEDPKTGQILAMVGSKDYFDDSIDGQVNVSTRLRQPGSSIKPIVYAKAFSIGYTPNTVLWDVVTDFPTVTGTYTPHDYDLKERGPIKLRDAIQMSLNIPAVKTVLLVGVENALDFATSMGYTTFGNHANFGPSMVLGGGEVKLIEHVGAYGVFANDGKLNEQSSILKVEDVDGNVLEEWKQKDPKQILDPNIAHIMSNVLSDNAARAPVFGANNYLQLGDRPVAAKTGTTNDNKDAWTIGYTPSIVVGVWAGNNNNKAMTNKGGGESAAGPIWNAFIKRALENTPVDSFQTPDIHATGKPILDGELPAIHIAIDKASQKLATEFTPESFKEDRVYAQYHEILQFVDPLNPLGDVPKNPSENPQYNAWESAVSKWLAKREVETGKKIIQTNPPTEYDDVHIPSNFPKVKIIVPEENSNISGDSLLISVDTNAPRGVSRVEYYIDNAYLGSVNQQPFSKSFQIPSSISSGSRLLKAISYDDIDNSATDTKNIQISSSNNQTSFEIIDPKSGQTIEKNKETYTVVISLQNPESISTLILFTEEIGKGNKSIISQINNPTTPFSAVDWKIPLSGNWSLSSQAKLKNGSSILSSGTTVTISSTNSLTEGEIYNPKTNLDPFSQR